MWRRRITTANTEEFPLKLKQHFWPTCFIVPTIISDKCKLKKVAQVHLQTIIINQVRKNLGASASDLGNKIQDQTKILKLCYDKIKTSTCRIPFSCIIFSSGHVNASAGSTLTFPRF